MALIIIIIIIIIITNNVYVTMIQTVGRSPSRGGGRRNSYLGILAARICSAQPSTVVLILVIVISKLDRKSKACR